LWRGTARRVTRHDLFEFEHPTFLLTLSLASRKFRRRKYEATPFFNFFFPCSSLTGVGRRIVARNGLLPPPSHLASAPAVPTLNLRSRVCTQAISLTPSRGTSPHSGVFFFFSLRFFLTHFDWAGPLPHLRRNPQHHHTLTRPSTSTPPHRHGGDTLDPTDTATTTTTPPRRRRLDTASPLPPLDPAAPAPSRHDPHHHPDVGTAIATHPVHPDPASTGAISTRPHHHPSVHPDPTPPRPHHTGAVSTRPPPLPDSTPPPPPSNSAARHDTAVSSRPPRPPSPPCYGRYDYLGRHRRRHLDNANSAPLPPPRCPTRHAAATRPRPNTTPSPPVIASTAPPPTSATSTGYPPPPPYLDRHATAPPRCHARTAALWHPTSCITIL
jgi:hypothetical protein